VLQEGEFERLGSTRTIKCDVRLVAATNRDLRDMVENREFRSDLYYRLNVFPIRMPPLRDRRDDVPLLIRYFAQKFAVLMKRQIETIPHAAMQACVEYDWPGNVRELQNFVERAVILTRGTALQLPVSELNQPEPEPPAAEPAFSPVTLESAERDHILRTLNETNWIIGGPTGAAARLGMKRTTLQSRMKKLGIRRD
jgi:formate hydrogenlyase transcriptional activator